jgi:hypothetical protein
MKKFKKHQNMIFEHIGVYCVRPGQKKSLRDLRGELLSISTNIGIYWHSGCDVFHRNENVQKAQKHDFWTYWSVLSAFVAKKSLRDSRCELLSINANIGTHGCDVFHWNEKVQKA